MPVTLTKLFSTKVLTTSTAKIFSLSEGQNAILENLVVLVANDTASAVDIDGHVFASGGTASADNKVIPTKSIPAHDYALLSIPVMSNGDELHMKASATPGVTVSHESGMPKNP